MPPSGLERVTGPGVTLEVPGAVVQPETWRAAGGTGDDNVEEAIIVVVADGDGRAAVDGDAARGDHVGELAIAGVVIERGVAFLAHDEDVNPAVAVEVRERRVASDRGAVAATQSHGLADFGEGAVEIVPIDEHRRSANQQQIQVAVVIDIDEQRFARARRCS